MRDVIFEAINDAHVQTKEEREEQSEEDREKREHEKLVESLKRQDKDDEHRCHVFEGKHGTFRASPPVERFPVDHPCAGFAMASVSPTDPLRAKKSVEDAGRYRTWRDGWIVRIVGPIHPRRKKNRSKKQKAADMDPEKMLSKQKN